MLSIKNFKKIKLEEHLLHKVIGGKIIVDHFCDIVVTDTGTYVRTMTIYDEGSFSTCWDRPMDDPINGEREAPRT